MSTRSVLLVCIIFSILISNESFSQQNTIKWSPGIKLNFSDFIIENNKGKDYIDVLVSFDYTFQPASRGKYFPVVKSEAILDRHTSSLADSSEMRLRHAQILFDLQGYQSKLLMFRVFKLGELSVSTESAKKKLDDIFFQTNQEVSQLRKSFDQDLNEREVDHTLFLWEKKVEELLSGTPDVALKEQVGNWQIGIFIGIGRSFFFGTTKEYFKDASGLNFGFEADLKRSRFAMDLNLDFNKTKNYFEKNGSWNADLKTHFANIEFTYGRKIAKRNWLFVPYAGLSINEFTPAKSDKGDKRDLTGYSPVVGFEINYNFKKLNHPDEKVNFFYKCKFSVNPSNLIKDYSGTQVNLKLAIGFDVSKSRTRLVYK